MWSSVRYILIILLAIPSVVPAQEEDRFSVSISRGSEIGVAAGYHFSAHNSLHLGLGYSYSHFEAGEDSYSRSYGSALSWRYIARDKESVRPLFDLGIAIDYEEEKATSTPGKEFATDISVFLNFGMQKFIHSQISVEAWMGLRYKKSESELSEWNDLDFNLSGISLTYHW